MSVRCTNYVWNESPATGNDRLVLLAIADEADDQGRNAYPSQDRIANKARVGRRTTQRATSRLEEGGELLVNRPARQGRGHHNRYVVVMGRDPAALATALGWPTPNLNPSVATEWQHDASGEGLAPIPDQATRAAAAPRNPQPVTFSSPAQRQPPTDTGRAVLAQLRGGAPRHAE